MQCFENFKTLRLSDHIISKQFLTLATFELFLGIAVLDGTSFGRRLLVLVGLVVRAGVVHVVGIARVTSDVTLSLETG